MFKHSVFGFFLGASVVLGFSLWALSSHTKTQDLNVSPTPISPINIKTAEAVMAVVPDYLSAVGHMRALQSAALSFQLGGQISKIYQQKGRVKQGDLLMELDSAEDQAQLAADQANLSLSQSTYDRFLRLSQLGDESTQILEEKKEALLTAQASVAKDQAILAEKQLRAPFDGVLGTMDLTVGSYVAAGAPVINLVQLAPLKARYTVPASYKPEIEIGQAVSLKTEDYPNQLFKGIVSYINPSVDTQSGTISIEATIQNSDFLLSPGMFVDVEQILNPNRQLLIIPDIALMTDVRGRYVFVLEPSVSANNSAIKTASKVDKKYVTVGLIKDGLASIQSGLNLGDQVVTAGQQRLYAGYSVNVIGQTVMTYTPAPKPAAS